MFTEDWSSEKGKQRKQELAAKLLELESRVPPTIVNGLPVDDAFDALSVPFSKSVEKKNYGGYTYIPSYYVLQRLRRILGTNFSITEPKIMFTTEYEAPTGRDGNIKNFTGVCVSTSIIVRDDEGNILMESGGTGADAVNPSPKTGIDKAVKTAFSNAIKIAAKGLGVALYLYND